MVTQKLPHFERNYLIVFEKRTGWWWILSEGKVHLVKWSTSGLYLTIFLVYLDNSERSDVLKKRPEVKQNGPRTKNVATCYRKKRVTGLLGNRSKNQTTSKPSIRYCGFPPSLSDQHIGPVGCNNKWPQQHPRCLGKNLGGLTLDLCNSVIYCGEIKKTYIWYNNSTVENGLKHVWIKLRRWLDFLWT